MDMDASSKNDIVRDQVVTIVNRKASTFFSTQTTARRVASIPLGVAIVITLSYKTTIWWKVSRR